MNCNSDFFPRIILPLICIIFLSVNCAQPHKQKDYIPIIKEIHKIECNQLVKHKINFTVRDTSVYTFRSIAFDLMMTKQPDLKLIAHYEELCQKLAAMEYEMNDEEKEIYNKDYTAEYLKKCY